MVDWRGVRLMTIFPAHAFGPPILLALSLLVTAGAGRAVKEDFSGNAPGKAWRVSPEILYTFAFLGRYHTVLDGPKSCILKNDRFVSVSSRMWILPGRDFSFKVERSSDHLAMALDGEKGPSFTDDSSPREAARLRLRIVFDPEGKDDAIRLDDLEVRLAKE